MKSEEYRLGYSFESLRDLEQVPLTSNAARDGYFLHESLERLLRRRAALRGPSTRRGGGRREGPELLHSGVNREGLPRRGIRRRGGGGGPVPAQALRTWCVRLPPGWP